MILTVGLNSAYQKVLVFDEYKEGHVIRAKEFHQNASGKGINVARAVHNLGGNAVSTGFIGGTNGLLMREMLKEEGVKEDLTMAEANTRVCVTVVNEKSGTCTELIEPSGEITEKEVKAFRATFTKQLKKAKLVAISGTLPPGCDEDLYSQLVTEAGKADVPVCADVWGEPLLLSFKGKRKPFLVKMNDKEFKDTFGERKLQDVITELLAAGVGILAVTFGKDGLVAASKEGIMLAMPPKIKPLNTTGAGDSMLGGFCRALESGCEFEGIIRAGTGAAAASALTMLPAVFTGDSAAKMSELVTVKKL